MTVRDTVRRRPGFAIAAKAMRRLAFPAGSLFRVEKAVALTFFVHFLKLADFSAVQTGSEH
ncbi:hypothetical protein [Bradyrhizobium japonicum]|uniref:hypothetical protein n=1 Tax=Bradyrhizobium japonicum TaxID=375 RepID=UPI0012BCA9D5|nr:hypothetical protein [Bradyrhizobium japonicum]